MLYMNNKLLLTTTIILATVTAKRTVSSFTTNINPLTITLRKMSCQTSYKTGTHSVAYVTAPNQDTAKKIARGLVEEKLAACVNIVPGVLSIYEWQDKIEEDSEVLMMIKTRSTKIGALTDYVKKNHPYDVCEVISLPIENGNDAYLDWISKTVPE